VGSWIAEEVCEFYEGLYGGRYYFVEEDKRLVHVSNYSKRPPRKWYVEGRRSSRVVCYDINFDKITGKAVIEISSDREGLYEYILKYRAEELALTEDKRERQELPISAINSYELSYLTLNEKRFLNNEWEKYYRPMLYHIKKVRNKVIKEDDIAFISHLMDLHLRMDLKYPLSFLIPDQTSRARSLGTLTKEIHQIWIVTRILEEFATWESNTLLADRTLNFIQGHFRPIAFIGKYSLWYEFDLNPHTMCGGINWFRPEIKARLKPFYERAERFLSSGFTKLSKLRPDIVFTQARDCEEFVENPVIKLIIECKNSKYEDWKKEISNQIIPYKEIFQPEYILIASLKPAPKIAHDISIIDNVYPGGTGEQELVTYIKYVLGT
jgi:hypothetical protein